MRLLHTADWQLGLKLRFVPGDRGAKARLERFEVVRRIAAVAREQAVDAVLVAGDVFDDNAIGPHTLQAAADALRCFAPIPVLLLPGNHDPATPGGALERLEDLAHVRVLLGDDPVTLDRLVVHPCPLRRRHDREDPTRRLGEPVEGAVNVVLAHGGVADFGESGPGPNRIDLPGVLGRGFDYVALGDWHGTLQVDARAWYPGTPEATRFSERDPGNVLLVDLGGDAPAVRPVPVGRTRWLQRDWTFETDADVAALATWLDTLEERAFTLLELTLRGALSLAAHARLDALVEEQREALLHLRVHDADLRDAPSEADLEALEAEGFVGLAAETLRADPEGRDALRLLHRLLAEAVP